MTAVSASQDFDANNNIISTNEAFLNRSSWTFAAATTGAVGAHTLFDITGTVAINVLALCRTSLTSGGAATVEVGTATSTACLCDQQTATNVDQHMTYHDNLLAVGANVPSHIHSVDEDVILTIGTTTVTGGVLDFYVTWRPLSIDGNLAVTTPA